MSNAQKLNDQMLERVPGCPPEINQQTLAELANVYAQVFAGPPWWEQKKCPQGEFFGPDSEIGDPCPNCGGLLAEAYPLAETREYIEGELARPDAAVWLLRTPEGELAGFS